MVESQQIKSCSEALEIEAFRYSDVPLSGSLVAYGESLPMSFPEVAFFRRSDEPNSCPGLGAYQDDPANTSPQEWKFRVLSESGTEALGTESQGGDVNTPLKEHGGSIVAGEALPRDVDEIESNELFQQRMAAEVAKAEERGQAKGIEIGFAQGREDASRELEDERGRLIAQAATLLESFSEVREICLHHLEREAVRLALAIAARVLRREAQTDPLLLTGAVRVALRQLANSTSVRLRVPAQDQAMWKESLALMPGLTIRPQVLGEPGMELGECRMETDLGSADLGLWAQLKAIERGFFDRVGDTSVQDRNADELTDQNVAAINPTRAGHEHSERDDERNSD